MKRILFITGYLVLFTIGAMTRIDSLGVMGRSADERTYTRQAEAIAREGVGATKRLSREFIKNRNLRGAPMPIKIGYLYPVAAVMKLTHSTQMKRVSQFSCAVSILTLCLLVAMGLRFFNPWITLCGLFFAAVSPLELTLAGRAWQDGFLALCALFMIYFCSEFTIARRRTVWLALFFLFGIYCLLIKESAIVIYALCAAWLLWIVVVKERSLMRGICLSIASIVGIGVSAVVLSTAVGGFGILMEVVKSTHMSQGTNPYNLHYQTGPLYAYIESLWVINPTVTFLSFIGVTIAFSSPAFLRGTSLRGKTAVLKGIASFIIIFITIVLIPRHLISLRFISVVFVPLYLMSGLGLWSIVSLARNRLKGPLFVAAAVLLTLTAISTAMHSYIYYKRFTGQRKFLDLSYGWIKIYSRPAGQNIGK